ncbi:MAG: hypothetical protein WAT09_09995 [Paracoccaceae bacterium]
MVEDHGIIPGDECGLVGWAAMGIAKPTALMPKDQKISADDRR